MTEAFGSNLKSAPVGTPSLLAMKQMLEAIQRAEPRLATHMQRSGPGIEDLKRLLEISQAINAVLELDRILEMVMDYAIELVSAERGFIMLVENGELVQRRAHNLAPEHFGADGDRISQTIARKVLQTGQSIYTSDAQEDERFLERQSVHDLHLRSIMGVPLKNDDQVIGVIYLDNSSQARLFLQSDLYILELLAQQASIALSNARLVGHVRSLQAYAENVVASAPVSLFVLDPLGRIRDQNERGARLLSELAARETRDRSWLDVVAPAARDDWATLFRGVLETGHANSWARYTLEVAGEARSYRINVSPLGREGEKPSGLVLTLDDITDSEKMREELLRAEVSIRKAEQIGDIAHEMNNFLTIICNQAEINKRALEAGDVDKVAGGIPRTIEAVDKINRLVEALLRPDRIEPEPRSIPLRAAVESLTVWLRAEKRFDMVELRIDVPATLPEVRFDPQHLEMILYNLCKNAAEAMAEACTERRQIAIEGRADGEFVVLTVEDTGPGLPPERAAKPWDPGASSKLGGHGRGLHNTSVFVRKNGGQIEARPRTERGGAGFTLRLPIAGA